MIGTLLCLIGLHSWMQDRYLTVYDTFPAPGDYEYQTPRRECRRAGCGIAQRWIPGYGGSEAGHWSAV